MFSNFTFRIKLFSENFESTFTKRVKTFLWSHVESSLHCSNVILIRKSKDGHVQDNYVTITKVLNIPLFTSNSLTR